MAKTKQTSTTIYWDTADSQNVGWAWRTVDTEGLHDSGPLDDDYADALDALMRGVPLSDDDRWYLQQLTEHFGNVRLRDTNGQDVGELTEGMRHE